ncbi:MAG: NAD-binding protein [Actinomycetales bacterium]|nr:NAD-binding protein [Actinomycetales bacterium]
MPLIVLILAFSVSVLGLTLIEGSSPQGPWRMNAFDAFYFMSYTATTIGFGEIPRSFNAAQRMWVTFSIYLTVVTWAYAIGALLALLQDAGLRRAVAQQRLRRRVNRIVEPFWVMAGFGQSGQLLGQWLDALGHRFVAIDLQPEPVELAELGSFRADVPGLVADARDPQALICAGISRPECAGVLALTGDDESNLAILMAASVLRPDLPVIARTTDRRIATRMSAFGSPTIINPYDCFGDHFRVELRAPAVEQLAHWLASAPGEPLPQRSHQIAQGHWIVCGYGRFGAELARDLRDAGIEIVAVDPDPALEASQQAGVSVLSGDGTDPAILAQARLAQAAGFVAGTDNDITNLSLVEAARRINPSIYIVARQNHPMNASLFDAMDLDLTMVPSRVVAQEAVARIGTPNLLRFLQALQHQDDAWAAGLIERIVAASGEGSPDLWSLTLTPAGAPALCRALALGPVTIADLLRDPLDREQALPVTALMLVRDDDAMLAPAAEIAVEEGDLLLLAGRADAIGSQQAMLQDDEVATYLLTGRRVASSWVLRRLLGTR